MKRVLLVLTAALLLTSVLAAAGNGAAVIQVVTPHPDEYGDRGIQHTTITPSGDVVFVQAGSGTDPSTGLLAKGVVVSVTKDGESKVFHQNLLVTVPDGSTVRVIVHMVDGDSVINK